MPLTGLVQMYLDHQARLAGQPLSGWDRRRATYSPYVDYCDVVMERISKHRWVPPWEVRTLWRRLGDRISCTPIRPPAGTYSVGMFNGEPLLPVGSAAYWRFKDALRKRKFREDGYPARLGERALTGLLLEALKIASTHSLCVK